MNEFNQHAFYHRILLRFGWQFVQHQQQLLIYRDGMANYVLNPGYHRPINRWRESYGEFVSTAIRMVQVEQSRVQTKDGIPVDVDVMYSFDANECASSGIMASIAGLSRRQMNMLVEKNVGRAALAVCSEYSEAELANGLHWHGMSRKIRTWLQRKIGILGLVFRGDTAVTITRITPPPIIDEARQLARHHQIYAQSVTQLPLAVARGLNTQDIARHSSAVQFTYVEYENRDGQHDPYPKYGNGKRPYQPNAYHGEEVQA